MSPLLDPFIRGVTVGALLIGALAVLRPGVSRHARVGTLLGMASIAAWTMTESGGMRAAFWNALPLDILAMVAGGSFWLFVAAVFEDQPIRGWALAPFAILIATGFPDLAPKPVGNVIWMAHNLFGGALCLYAGVIIVRGWRDDLIESRRRLRGIIFGFAALFGVIEVAVGFAGRIDPDLPGWRAWSVGGVYGGLVLAILTLATAALLLQGGASLFGPARRAEVGPDPRAEAADRQLMAKLDGFMGDGGWRSEGLTIGAVAQALDTPEHRLRRLINQKLGHRNFADFVNGHRIAAAKARLRNPAEARTTVAAIAFDLGYGSLGPFNRAFRAATGSTPTEWRRQALAETSPILEEAV